MMIQFDKTPEQIRREEIERSVLDKLREQLNSLDWGQSYSQCRKRVVDLILRMRP